MEIKQKQILKKIASKLVEPVHSNMCTDGHILIRINYERPNAINQMTNNVNLNQVTMYNKKRKITENREWRH